MAFSPSTLDLLLCPGCSAQLEIGDVYGRAGAPTACTHCHRRFSVQNGIVSFLDQASLVGESAREQRLRDEQADFGMYNKSAAATLDDAMEVHPTLATLCVRPDDSILELGCGNGRFTSLIAGRCRALLGVDFSLRSLEKLQERLDWPRSNRNVSLAHASITDFAVKPRSFDVVFSTLTSNLPDHRHREAMYRLAATALKPTGRFVLSAHHYGIRERVAQVPKSGLYRAGGIFRHCFTIGELTRELRAHFRCVDVRPIQIYLPMISRSNRFRQHISSWTERLAPVNRFGSLLLAEARM